MISERPLVCIVEVTRLIMIDPHPFAELRVIQAVIIKRPITSSRELA